MAVTTFKTVVKSIRNEEDSCGFKMIFNEDDNVNLPMIERNYIEMQLNSLGACHMITAKTHSPRFEVEIEDMWVEVEGDLDLEAMKGNIGLNTKFAEIRFMMHFVTDAMEEQIKELVKEVKRLCPVSDSISPNYPLTETDVKIEKLEYV